MLISFSNLYPSLFSAGKLILLPCLLNAFTKYIKPEYLLIGIEILVLNFFVILLFVYVTLYRKKRNFFFLKKIQTGLEVWVTEAILDDAGNTTQFNIPQNFLKQIKKTIAKQFVIDELIKTKKSLTGNAAVNICNLYIQLGLKNESLHKLKSRKWYIKARAIYELYSMQQMDALIKIYKQTNSENAIVRMEAQTGVINMTGFEGLRFLDIVTYPITQWQQIELLDQLKLYEENGELAMYIPKWLTSKNDTVILFALKLADVYQQFFVHDAVVKCLEHNNASVRLQTIKTLVRVANETTPQILVNCYPNEKFTNQLAILDALTKIATSEQAWFLIALLDDESDVVKLKAGRILATCFPLGLEALEERGKAPYGPYRKIYLHIKSELEK